MSESENQLLREEVAMLESHIRNLKQQLKEARETPAIPESAIRAVWEHGFLTGMRRSQLTSGGRLEKVFYDTNRELIGTLFTEALKRGD